MAAAASHRLGRPVITIAGSPAHPLQESRNARTTSSRPRDQPPAVVIGLDSVTGLQTARTLAARGVPVIGVAGDRRHPCARTNACDRIVITDTSGPGLVAALLRLGPQIGGPAVLVPCTDLSVLLVSRNRAALAPWYRMALPEPEQIEMLIDKASFSAFAQREGLPVPRTLVLRGHDDAEAAARSLRFPAVLKPAVKSAQWQRQADRKAYRITSRDELMLAYQRCAQWTDCLVVQEWIEGRDDDHYTCNCYFSSDSEPLATFVTRKLRQWPPHGGEACLSEEVRDETVLRETIRVFRAVRHHGFGYLEMKREARTGEYLIIEPNAGRPTGRSAAAEAAGVDLLYTMYCELTARPLPEQRRQGYHGRKWIHLRRDCQAAARLWWRGDLNVSAWVASLRGPTTEALFSWGDPVPFWADLVRVGLDVTFRRKAARRATGG